MKQLEKIGAFKFSDTSLSDRYWCARRNVGKYAGYPQFRITSVLYNISNNTSSPMTIYHYKADGSPYCSSASLGFRPVIKLRNNIKIEKGKGTADEPYEIGI